MTTRVGKRQPPRPLIANSAPISSHFREVKADVVAGLDGAGEPVLSIWYDVWGVVVLSTEPRHPAEKANKTGVLLVAGLVEAVRADQTKGFILWRIEDGGSKAGKCRVRSGEHAAIINATTR